MAGRGAASAPRIRLRRWREADRAPFAALNADPEVVRYLPASLTPTESDELIARIEAHFERHRFGLWALELRSSGELIGFTGLNVVPFQAHFTPAVEVGWRLRRSAWGHGYATEAALAALSFAFDELDLEQVVSYTTSGTSARAR